MKDVFVRQLLALLFQSPARTSGLSISATLRDDGGTEVLGSPVALFHVGEGTYARFIFSMPAIPFCALSPAWP